MHFSISRVAIARRAILVSAVFPLLASAAQDIRIVTFNIQDDSSATQNYTQTEANVSTVLEGLSEQNYNTSANGGNAGYILQKADVVGLEETYSNSTSVATIVSNLNTFFGSSVYNSSNYQATAYTSNPIIGNGPNALIYNQTTLNLMASVGVGTPAGGTNNGTGVYGEFRQVGRYELQPLVDKGTNTGAFYVYVSHTKSGSQTTAADGSTDGGLRNDEAVLIRSDEASLPSTASVFYVGDFNMDGSYEDAYKTLTSTTTQGGGVDPQNVINDYTLNYSNSSLVSLKTESDSSLQYRDDIQFMTQNVYNGSDNSLHLIPGSYHVFGNNGTTLYQKNTNLATNTAVNDITGYGGLTPAIVLAAMNKSIGSDHLPVVADYSIVTIANGIWNGGIGNWSVAANWSNNVVPNDSTLEVKIDNSNAVSSIVTMDTTATISDLILDAGDMLNITATHSLTISNSSVVTLLNGTLNNAGTLNVANVFNTGTFNTSNSFTASGSFNNSGTAAFSGAQAWAAGSILNNIAGTSTLASDAGTATSLTLKVNVSGGSVVLSSNQHLASLSLAAGTTVTASLPSNHSTHTLITVGTFMLAGTTPAWAGKLDLTGNDLDVQSGSLFNITSQVKAGFNGGAWNGGNGITSSAAFADSTHLTALGVIQNNQSGSALFTNKNFDGTTPGIGDILVKYTYYGDANLSGKVDGSDYSLIDSGFRTGATGWFNGDFNYDGVVNGSDYALIDNAFNSQGSVLTAVLAEPTARITAEIASTSSVPEPVSSVMIAVAATAMLRRRRKI